MPFVSRTRATLRSAEFGFFGVVVYTRVQTPRRWGAATRFLRPLPDFRPGVASFFFGAWRPLRTSWEVVGIRRGMVAVGIAPARVGCGHGERIGRHRRAGHGREQATAAVERTVAELGRLDIVVNNAGVMLLGPVEGAPTEEWERMVALNV